MKLIMALMSLVLLGFIGFARAQNPSKNDPKKEVDTKPPSSPVENHGQEKAHEHGGEGHEHTEKAAASKNEAHDHGKEGDDHGKEKDEHGHEHGKEGDEHAKEKDEHGHEHGKEEGDEHGHGERNNVGPDKGVLEAEEDKGFKLRDGVEERFGIKSETLTSDKRTTFPKSAIVYSKEDYQIFRKRDGFWKPINVKALRKGSFVSIESNELRAGDSVATEGTGSLKIIELSVFGPAIEGHIH